MTNPKKLFAPAQLGLAAATYYTAPVNTKCVVKKLTFTNTSAAAVQVTVYLVPSGGAAADSNTLRKNKTLAAEETWECYEAANHVLSPGDFIQALADTATSVTIQGSGVELT